MTAATANSVRAFEFERDTFAYPHELVWKYNFDPVTGAMSVCKADPPPAYYHRCFVLVRATRQFFYHARFNPDLPRADAEACRKLIKQIVGRDVRRRCPETERIVVPGFDGLRAFSRAHEPLLKAHCGAPWESYFLRSHWRMIFPVPTWYREMMVKKLKESLPRRGLTLVHLFCFPKITINHGIALFGFAESETAIEFDAYDPNIPEHPVKLVYEKGRRQFTFAPNRYWGGGVLKVMEIYADWPY
ncbi:MAG TPA: hypothetical protein VMF08_01900 [Candidatus Sulfotelmatobacter sp.]|nr:hypothetical protein [Candidatus Sulfotelmatobacter sp.]